MSLTSDQITAQNFADFYQMILPYLNGGGMGMKLLWENPNPTQSFAEQDITLSSDDYDLLLPIGTWRVDANTSYDICDICRKGYNALISFGMSNALSSRTLIRNSDTSYHVGKGYSGTTENANYCVPQKIYGIKVYNRDVPAHTTLLWSNPDPSSAFASGNITLDSSDYDELEVFCYYNKNGNNSFSAKGLKGHGFILSTMQPSGSPAGRYVTRNSDTSFTIGATVGIGTDPNDYIIPVAVYGIKL